MAGKQFETLAVRAPPAQHRLREADFGCLHRLVRIVAGTQLPRRTPPMGAAWLISNAAGRAGAYGCRPRQVSALEAPSGSGAPDVLQRSVPACRRH